MRNTFLNGMDVVAPAFIEQRYILKVGTHEGTKIPSCALPILVKKCSRRDQNLVPATSPTDSNKFEFVGLVPETGPTNYAWSLRVYCSWDKSLRRNENISSDLLLFYS